MKKDTYREAHTETDTLDPLTRHGRLRALSGYIGAKGGWGYPAFRHTKLQILEGRPPDNASQGPFSTLRWPIFFLPTSIFQIPVSILRSPIPKLEKRSPEVPPGSILEDFGHHFGSKFRLIS